MLRKYLTAALLVFALAVTLLGPIFAFASSGGVQACYNIPNSDARSYCLAVAHRDSSQCYNIKRADLRQQCIAEVGR